MPAEASPGTPQSLSCSGEAAPGAAAEARLPSPGSDRAALRERAEGSAKDSSTSSTSKTLYVGNLHFMCNELVLQDIFGTLGAIKEVKIIKDKVTALSAGYGFVEYVDPRCAELALNSINGRVLYGQEVRVNWAYQRTEREDTSKHFHIFVGDLSSEVHDRALFEAFAGTGNCSDARVMWDHATGRSKGYGFVSFRTKEDAERAIQAMDGQQVGNRRVRCGWAQHKADNTMTMDELTVDRADPTNNNVYIGNISPEVSDADLKAHFAQFGPVLEVKLYRKGSYGFVRYQKHAHAVRAIVTSNGLKMGDRALKCSWGRFQNSSKGKISDSLVAAMAAVGLGPQPHHHHHHPHQPPAGMLPAGTLVPHALTPIVLAPAQAPLMMPGRGMGGSGGPQGGHAHMHGHGGGRPPSQQAAHGQAGPPVDPSMAYYPMYYQQQ